MSYAIRNVVYFILLICVRGNEQIIEDDSSTNETISFENTYKDKICRSEKTCYLIDAVHPDLQTLKSRNCMCDEECVKYGDCCEDSLYQTRNQNSSKIELFHCSPTEKIYMKTSCPSNYTNRSVKGKCESSARPLQSENRKIYIPVTNVRYNITYGNEYCAICNNDYTYQTWNLTARCWVIYDPQQSTTRSVRSIDETITQAMSSETVSTTTYVDWYALDLEEAKKRIQFDPRNKTFFSEYKDKVYECQYLREIPNDLKPHIRDCVPAISNCSLKNDPLEKLCRSYTSIVYDIHSLKAYKNVDCARCNGALSNLYGCPYPPTKITGSSLFTTSDKNSGKPPPCSNASVKNKFC